MSIRRKSIEVYEKIIDGDFHGTADQISAEFQRLKTVYGEDAVFSLDADYDWDSCDFGIFVRYTRLETDAEFAKRKVEAEKSKKVRESKLARERAEYERLAKKFGKK